MSFERFKFSDYLHTDVPQINTPFEWQHIRNIERMDQWLEAFATTFGHPLFITSGYRTPVVNQKVGGAKNSYHTIGLAVDLTTEYRYGDLLVHAAKDQINDLDQLIIYYNKEKKGVRWIHVALPKDGDEPRKQIIVRYK